MPVRFILLLGRDAPVPRLPDPCLAIPAHLPSPVALSPTSPSSLFWSVMTWECSPWGRRA
jgi:hypothetical protein